ncbi:MAG: MoaD/ThiS family protein, partial [Anaerolineales bacterium]
MATVKIKYRNKEYEVNAGMTVRDAIRKVGLEPETVLAVMNGQLVTDDTIIREGMEIKLVAVGSGGAALTPALSQREREQARAIAGVLPSPSGRG